MIARLTGVIDPLAEDEVVLDVDGVGYHVFVPTGTAAKHAVNDEPVTLEIHTEVREKTFELYGFPSPEQKALFEEVISISRIGPKLGLSLLSAMPPAEVVRNVRAENNAAFTDVSGIGKKKAKRLVLELQDKVDDLAIEQQTTQPAAVASDLRNDLQSALKNFGYEQSEINHAINQLGDEIAEADSLEPLVRKSLDLLTGS